MQYFEQGIFVALVLVANEGASHYSDKLRLGGWRDFLTTLGKLAGNHPIARSKGCGQVENPAGQQLGPSGSFWPGSSHSSS